MITLTLYIRKVVQMKTKKFLLFAGCLVLIFAFSSQVFAEEIALDSSGNGHDSYELSGTFVAEGKVGGALQFNGDGDMVALNDGKMADNPFLHTAFTEKSIALWFKAAHTSGQQMLYEQGGSVKGLALRINEGQLEVGIAGKTDVIIRELFQTPFTDTNNWNHVALTYDKGQVKLYLNGELKIDTASTVLEVGKAANPGGFGANVGNNNAYNENDETMFFEGLIDDVRIYSSAIVPTGSGSDIVLPEDGLEAWYKLDEGAETQAAPEETSESEGNSEAAESEVPAENNPNTSDTGIIPYVLLALISGIVIWRSRKKIIKQ